MNLATYATEIERFAKYPSEHALVYLSSGLISEVGELFGELKRVYRNDGGKVTPERLERFEDEIGDVLWYVGRLTTHKNLPGYFHDNYQAKMVSSDLESVPYMLDKILEHARAWISTWDVDDLVLLMRYLTGLAGFAKTDLETAALANYTKLDARPNLKKESGKDEKKDS